MRPFAPAEMRLSTAATCDSLSPSFLPAKDCTEAPSGVAALLAPSFIFTKNGLVAVFVISPTFTASLLLEPPLLAPPLLLPLSLPQAARPAASAQAEPTARIARPLPSLLIATHSPRPGPLAPRQRFQNRVVRVTGNVVKRFEKTNSDWTTGARAR